MENSSENSCVVPRIALGRPRSRKLSRFAAVLLCGGLAASSAAQGIDELPQRQPAPLGPVVLTYDDGDLFIGFRATDRTSCYLVKIGQPAPFVNATPGSTFPVSVGNTGPDLISAFGSDWCTRIDPNTKRNAVLWAVVGGRQVAASGDPANVLYSTNPSSTPWNRRSDTAQSFTTSLISAMGNTYSGNNSTVNNPQGLVQSATGTNSYRSFQPGGPNSGGISFGTWNPSNEGVPADILFFNRIIPGSGASGVLGTFQLDCNGQLSFTATAASSPTPTPPPLVNISGTVTYCSDPLQPAVADVTITRTGTSGGVTTSDSSGNYVFSGLAAGGNYAVTPTKAGLAPATAGINGVDALAVQRHFLQIALIPPGCPLMAADVTEADGVNSVDASAIQRFFLGFTTGIANTGQYRFNPTSRSYLGISSDQTAQNFGAMILGDVVPSFAPARPGGGFASAEFGVSEVGSTVARVALPDVAVDAPATRFVAAVTSSVIDGRNNLVGFQGDFTFDERIVTFDSNPVTKAGMTRGNWNVLGNVLPGPGPIRTLRVMAFSNDFTPLSGEGTLFELGMIATGKVAERTPLIWSTPPGQFIFIDANLNTQRPAYAATGGVTVSGHSEAKPR